jgi:cytochrome b6-f complex iron-sulfur subunit
MPDRDEERAADRVDRLVGDLERGRPWKAGPSDAPEHDAILTAAQLAGAKESYPRMSPAFKKRLEHLLRTEQPKPAAVSRRTALFGGLGLAAGAVGGAVAAHAWGPLSGTPAARPAPQPTVTEEEPIPSAITPDQNVQRWWDTGLMLAQLRENKPVRVTAGSVGAFVVRRGNSVAAMSAYCTHVACELHWVPSGRVLNCPCHNANFDLSGESLGYKWPTLPSVNVRVTVDGRVEVLGTQ